MLRVAVASLIAIGALAACGQNDDGSSDEEAVAATSPSDGAAIQMFRFSGGSMQPTFEDGMLLEVHAYVDELPQRGNVIVFSSPIATEREFMKRVIGLPGEVINIDEEMGVVLINGEVLAEPYVQGVTRCGAACEVRVPESHATRLPQSSPQGFAPGTDYGPVCQMTACYFVMGDNRQNSSDSRQGWLVPAENIVGWVEEP